MFSGDHDAPSHAPPDGAAARVILGLRTRLASIPRARLVFHLVLVLAICLIAVRLYLFAVKDSFVLTTVNGRWSVLDWLISYQGGFVRRGLPGEIFFWLSDLTGLEPQVFAYITYMAVSAVMLGLMYALFVRVPDATPALALIFAPFMMSFDALTLGAGGRKDGLLLCMIAALALAHAWRSKRQSNGLRPVEIALLAFPLLVLSHEALFLFFPYILAFAWLEQDWPQRMMRVIGFGSLSVVAFIAAVAFHGSPEVVQTLCADLGRHTPSLTDLQAVCLEDSPIKALQWSPGDALELLKVKFANEMVPSVPLALFLIVLAFLPIVPELTRPTPVAQHVLRVLVIATVAGLVLSAPLYFVAVDWGRWMRLHAAIIGMIAIAGLCRIQQTAGPGGPTRAPFLNSRLYVGLVAAYALTWSLSHIGRLIEGGIAGDVVGKVFHVLVHS